MTYAELNARANRLAHHLRALGVRPDDRVAICVERSLEMVVGVLAILKAGGGYVPLDPGYPVERLAFMLKDSKPTVVLDHGAARAALEAAMAGLTDRPPVVDLEGDRPWSDGPASDPQASSAGLTPRHLAYVIYTSGSTGLPKGVMVEHRNVVRLFTATEGWFHFDENDVWTLFHSFAFDFSVWEIWGALFYGGRLVVVPRPTTRSRQDFYQLLRKERVTVLNQTPSAFSQVIAAQEDTDDGHSLRYVIFGGEALNAGALKYWFRDLRNQNTRLINMYGITETTVHVTYYPLSPADSETQGSSRIGRPIPDLTFYILDDRGEPVPIGAPGEIHVGGAGVARGYLNRPELTAERFIPSPFVDGDRLYRSGDLGQYRPDGTIEYLGRNDFQVKIRGFRIELGEIEARLAEHPAVRETVVLAREDAPDGRRLVAYYTTRPGAAAPGALALRAHLAASLPEYMVPAAYVALESMPLNANGKLDRKTLPAPSSDAFGLPDYEPPQGKTEEKLAQFWAEALKLDRVGREDNFFDLGGHSLLAMDLASRINASFKTSLPLSTVFHAPTIATLAEVLEQQRTPPQWYSLVPNQPEGSRPPLFCIEVVGGEFFKYIGADQPVYSLRFGIGSPRGSVLRLPKIEDLAAHYIREIQMVQPKGPYFLVGYSWGGLVAYEIAQQLTAQGEVVDLVTMVDTLFPNSPRKTPVERSTSQKFIERMKYKVKTRVTIENSKSKLKKMIYGSTYYRPDAFDLETVHTVMRSYHARPYSGRVFFFNATEDLEGWKRLVGPGLEVEEIICDHHGLMRGQDVAKIARKIRASMDKAITREPRTEKEVREPSKQGNGADAPPLP